MNYALLAFTSVVFVLQLTEGRGRDRIVEGYGMIPVRVFHPEARILVPERVVERGLFGMRAREVNRELGESAVPPWLTLFTCILLHGGWMHFLGNMWTLYIFGDNVEDRFGHLGYLLFYVASGVAASIAHLFTNPDSGIPTIGASGAIAGVMGAYMLLYPRAKVLTLVPIFVFLEVMVLPAPVFLGLWFVLQFFQGTLSITSTQTGGVAWWAHIGGFAFGFVLAYFLRNRGVLNPRVEVIRAGMDRFGARQDRSTRWG